MRNIINKSSRFVFVIAFLLIVFAINFQSVSAQEDDKNGESFYSSSDEIAIMEREDVLIKMIKEIVPDECVQQVTASDLSLEDAIKVYLDLDIFSNDTMTKSELDNYIKDATYVWLIPIYMDDNTYMVTICKGLPLNEEIIEYLSECEINTIKENEGKWIVSEVRKFEENFNYREVINDTFKNKKNDETIYLGGCPGINQVIAAVWCDGEVNMVEFSNRNEDETSGAAEGSIFSFEEMQEQALANELEPNETGGYGEVPLKGNNIVVFILGAVIICGGIFVVFGIKKGERRK